jgi:hypothetical protein
VLAVVELVATPVSVVLQIQVVVAVVQLLAQMAGMAVQALSLFVTQVLRQELQAAQLLLLVGTLFTHLHQAVHLQLN